MEIGSLRTAKTQDKRTLRIPLELKTAFLRDPDNFLRDIACISTETTRPFIRRKELIGQLIEGADKNPFNEKNMLFDSGFKCTDKFARYMHIDLGLNKDAVGISMCHAPHFVHRDITILDTREIRTESTRVPFVKFDFLGRIKARKGEEIILADIRSLITDQLARKGFYIKLITFDGFQSVDSIQILESQGYRVGRLSVQRTATKIVVDKHADKGLRRESTNGELLSGVNALKDLLYDKRLQIPYHEYWEKEAKGAEVDWKKNKVDHPAKGTLDLFQSMCGSAFNLITNEHETVDDSAVYEDKLADGFYDDYGYGHGDNDHPDSYLYGEDDEL